MTTLQERFEQLPARDFVDALRVERGTMADYARLARFHYRAGRPVAVTRVLVVRDGGVSVLERFERGRLRRTAKREGEVVAGLVETWPVLSCRLRDVAMRERYGRWLAAGERARLLNEEVRSIARVVVDPRWRGAGVAVRLVRHALETATTPVTEALAAMGHVSPFFARAGMTAYHRPPHLFDARLTAALRLVGLEVGDLVLPGRAWARIDALPAERRSWLLGELQRWHRQSYGRDWRRRDGDPAAQLRAAAKRLAMTPVYFVRVRDEPEETAQARPRKHSPAGVEGKGAVN